MSPAVYRILIGGREYIGSSKLPARRFRQHLCELRKGRHHSPALQNSFNKHGEGSIIFEILANVMEGDLESAEQSFIDMREPELNAIKCAGAGRMHRDDAYLARLREGVRGANLQPNYLENRRLGQAASMRSVICLNDGEFFRSVSEAARRYSIPSGAVSACASGMTQSTAAGIIFRYADGSSPQWVNKKVRRAVVCRTTGQRFPSIYAAAQAVGVSRASIHHALKNGSLCRGRTLALENQTNEA